MVSLCPSSISSTNMTARHLLETDGATWRFRHRILQEYFAEQWKEPPPLGGLAKKS
ncbi:MAG: hypothetical protein K9J37_19865 [Saprospiraceae bacterium]|nr:hypothetical protein [Saprospiraceae bacterium]MCF8252184.1 hypothetical protein [Saprospiraceae bacterium]MCF8281563.1 hypothetical protein [Bacteroidales bacterium]MCF8313853.1 hypothetical protein [Saprospiraceae bacterium]MCF8442555.1 hypothetical protein [Saprospiraceae bacterium]